MNKKDWRPVEITERATRRALAVGGVTDNATKYQVSLVTAAQHKTLGSITVSIPVDIRNEIYAEIDSMKAGLVLMPTSDKLGLPQEMTAEDLAIYKRVFG